MSLPAADPGLDRCKQELLDQFTTYDQAVDVVSCFQAIFEGAYAEELTYFDRFPEMAPGGLTPDFGVLLLGEYGIVGETKRTFPRDQVAFERELKQLENYDVPLDFRSDSLGSILRPETHDIMVLINANASAQVAHRIEQAIQSGVVRFSRNLILLEYFFDGASRVTKYTFRKFPGQNRPFRDVVLPRDKRLEVILGERSESFEVKVPEFMRYKITEILCNDKPPPIYLAVYLWNNVFYNLLPVGQRKDWSRGNPKQILPVETTVDDLCTTLKKDYLPRARIHRSWVKEALEFLATTTLATRLENDAYEIRFSNRKTLLGTRHYGERSEQEQDEIREYGGMFAEAYCLGQAKGTAASPPAPAGRRKVRQATFEGSSKVS